jgi:hypothetical protein
VVFAVSPALEQQLLALVEDQDGKGAMQQTLAVYFKLARGPLRAVVSIDTDNLFFFIPRQGMHGRRCGIHGLTSKLVV